jgi:membrane protease YdiL (CAAX protease family)
MNYVSREIWHSLGSIGPAIGGLVALSLSKKREGLFLLKDRLTKFSGWKILVFAFVPLIILLISLLFESIFGLFNIVQFIEQNSLYDPINLLVFILPSLFYGFFEEIGWRGFFLPHLQEKFNALRSTLILTLVWWFWHFPTFFYRFNLLYGFVFMFPLMLTGSIVFTFLFNQSNGNLLMIILLHISYNLVTSQQISLIAIILVSTFYVFMDIRIIKLYGVEHFSTQERVLL